MEITTDTLTAFTPEETVKVIKAQALEIKELQAVIVRLRGEMQQMHRNEHRAIEILVHGEQQCE